MLPMLAARSFPFAAVGTSVWFTGLNPDVFPDNAAASLWLAALHAYSEMPVTFSSHIPLVLIRLTKVSLYITITTTMPAMASSTNAQAKMACRNATVGYAAREYM